MSRLSLSVYFLVIGFFPPNALSLECPEPAQQVGADIKGDVSAEANFLTKMVGAAGFEGELEIRQKSLIEKYPNADKLALRLSFLAAVCTAIDEDTSLSGGAKAEKLYDIWMKYENLRNGQDGTSIYTDPDGMFSVILPHGLRKQFSNYLNVYFRPTNNSREAIGHRTIFEGNMVSAVSQTLYVQDTPYTDKQWKILTNYNSIKNESLNKLFPDFKKHVEMYIGGNNELIKQTNSTNFKVDRTYNQIDSTNRIHKQTYALKSKTRNAHCYYFTQVKAGIIFTFLLLFEDDYMNTHIKELKDTMHSISWDAYTASSLLKPVAEMLPIQSKPPMQR